MDMAQTDELQKQEYNKYVEQVTPKHNMWVNLIKAYAVGGVVCCVGQFILNYGKSMGLEKDMAGSWTSLLLILASVVLTALNLFASIAKFAGAGILVPITGFANGVASSAIEFKKEGQVFGIGCKIFTIAGPVILYGVFTSWVLGFFYWLGKLAGLW